jgi:hypothetical protein
MNEIAAREVTLLQAFESARPAPTAWNDEDRAWADRVALEAADGQPAADAFVAHRARHALQRLGSREAAARALTAAAPRARGGALLMLLAFGLGLAADAIGSGQRINLLAPPLWGVLAWNAVVYLLLLAALLAALLRRAPPTAGPVVRALQAVLRAGRRLPSSGANAAAWRQFAALWAQRSARLWALRAETVLHASAAALAFGLIAGLYARGLVLDFRVHWESTFLEPGGAHALVSLLLAPASRLSGIALPDATVFAALRSTHGDIVAGAPAAPWIQLLALTLALFVVLPRLVLALACAARAAWRGRRFVLPLADPYFQRLARLQRGAQAQVQAWPYATTPTPQAALALRAALAVAFGPRVGLQVEPAVVFGGEDHAVPALAPGTSHAVAWFDLSATPEPQAQGRFVRRLAAAAALGGASVVALVDEAAFRRRFEGAPERLQQRRDAWRTFCAEFETKPVFIDLDAPDDCRARALLGALEGLRAGDSG